MARKKKDAAGAAFDESAAPPPADHNQMTGVDPDTWIKHAREIESARRIFDEAQEESRAAKGKLNAARKRAKKAGLDMKVYDHMRYLESLGQDEAALFMRKTVEYSAWGSVPIGTQADMFGDIAGPSQEASEELTKERVDEAGYAAGRKAFDRADNPHPQGTEFFVVWDKAWLRGQAANAPKLAEAETIAPARRKRGEDVPPGALVN